MPRYAFLLLCLEPGLFASPDARLARAFRNPPKLAGYLSIWKVARQQSVFSTVTCSAKNSRIPSAPYAPDLDSAGAPDKELPAA